MATALPPDSGALVEFAGEYDLASKETLRAALAFLENATPAILDFSAVTYIDSTVLSQLALLHRNRQESGLDQLTLILQNPSIRRLLQIAAMTEIFNIVETRTEAVNGSGDSIQIRHASSFE